MNKFVSSLLGAFVGTWIAFFLMGIFIFFVGIMIITSASLSSVSIEVKDNSILRIDLSGSITDKPYNKTLQDILEGSSDDGNSLHEILAAIDNASTDDRIKGIYLRCDAANTGMATASAIRKALSDFKKESGKWIYAYGHSYSQLDYYIASVADSLFINPSGMLDIHGLTATTMYYKELLDKIGVDVQIVKVGTFKSATEPFSQTSMSEANRLQSQTYLNNMWSVLRDDIAKSRKIKADAITEYADSLYMFRQPTLAKEKGFIDGICYEHQFESKLHRKIGIANDEELNLISASQFANAMFIEESPADNRIAVLYAEGEINTTGDEYSINSEEIVPQIIELADDPAIKGMVLRVNSPGRKRLCLRANLGSPRIFQKQEKASRRIHGRLCCFRRVLHFMWSRQNFCRAHHHHRLYWNIWNDSNRQNIAKRQNRNHHRLCFNYAQCQSHHI